MIRNSLVATSTSSGRLGMHQPIVIDFSALDGVE
jgi:hypothetical protein